MSVKHDHDDHSHMTETEARVRALETLLSAKGYIDSAAVDRIIQTYETKIGPQNGAHVVAKSWCDPEFAAWLRRDATAAIHSLGYISRQGEHMEAVFNSDDVHHLTVCTLCSCYPWSVLGLPPTWYKSPPFRSRAVIDPRGVLREFGLDLPTTTKVEVHDSTAEIRYLVIPQRPAGTEGFSEDQLVQLVTRDTMIGTAVALLPEGVA
ncbi:nitrile hydratase subunit alpha [Paracoccus sp. JM45]|uniref:nitrile hydratase subunit alpha n=1 Tax=Paracoccus sp. JM45 TaxID=2283626 RepID=UPI000E6C6A1A|nr:nitrile hydratase subunit alpha [Paracoccus sp. JM45]RJE78987.1 nitrile hydratase subunit alpha [Paracoccus sp. JM45]